MATLLQQAKDYIDSQLPNLQAKDAEQDLAIENLKNKNTEIETKISSIKVGGDYASKPPASIKIKNKVGRVIAELNQDSTSPSGEKLVLGGSSGEVELDVGGLTIEDKPYITERPLPAYDAYVPRTYTNFDPLATAVIDSLGHGLNFGQTWDATNKWAKMDGMYRNVTVSVEHMRRAYECGFRHVRLPIRISGHTTITTPYTVDQAYLNNYFTLVDEALAIGLKVIVDNHDHTSYLNQSGGDGRLGGTLPRSEQLIRQRELTVQFAQRASQYAWQDVLIELENEPNGRFNADWNNYWPTMLSAVRAAVPDHILLIGGKNYNKWDELDPFLNLNDDRVALVAHAYDPFNFTHNDKNPASVQELTDWRINNAQEQVDNIANVVNTHGRPVLITEIGVANVTTLGHRDYYLRHMSSEFNKVGCQCTWWNAYGDFCLIAPSGQFIGNCTQAITGQEPTALYNPPIPAGANIADLPNSPFCVTGSLWASVSHSGMANRDDDAPLFTMTEDTFSVDVGVNTTNFSGGFVMIPYLQLRGQDAILKIGDTIRITSSLTFRIQLTSYKALEIDYNWLPLPISSSNGQEFSAGTHDILLDDKNAPKHLREMVQFGLTVVFATVGANTAHTFKVTKL